MNEINAAFRAKGTSQGKPEASRIFIQISGYTETWHHKTKSEKIKEKACEALKKQFIITNYQKDVFIIKYNSEQSP